MTIDTLLHSTNLQKLPKVSLLCAIFFLLPLLGRAQFNPKNHAAQVETQTDSTAKIQAPPPSANLKFQLYSDAYDKYMKKLLFKRRNVVKSAYSFNLTQASFNNWAAGGDNSFSALATGNIEHTYTAEVFSIKTVFDGKYGMINSNKFLQKNMDYFNITTTPSWNISKRWKLSGSMVWKTQFSNSFRYPKPDSSVLVAGFMSPGTIDLSVGLTFESLNKKFNFYISPLGGKMIMVLNPELANKGGFGIDHLNESQFFKAELGANMRINYAVQFAKSKIGYTTKLEAFWNYIYIPSAVWENTIDFKFTNIFTAKIFVQTLYNDQVMTPNVKDLMAEHGPDFKVNKWNYLQVSQTFGIGLTFRIDSKPKEPIKESTITRSRLKYTK